jgi:hypothetical protein
VFCLELIVEGLNSIAGQSGPRSQFPPKPSLEIDTIGLSIFFEKISR